jgi:HTH-type transcriptional regulator/antitoxin HigA
MLEPVTNQYDPDRVSPPGETLLESIEALGLSQAELAERLGRPKKTVNEIIQGKTAITPETALQLEAVLGVPADFWISREARYSEYLARCEETARLATWVGWARHFPFRAMVRLGWVADQPPGAARVRELLRFFGAASPDTWQETWSRQQIAFRRSAKVSGSQYAIAAWLRRGEAEGQKEDCAPYDADRFRAALNQARALTTTQPEVFQPELGRLVASAGVALVWVPELPGVPASGATRWISPEKALIQLSLRYRTDDHLWFSLFHEAAHVLKHGRKLVFIEDGAKETEEEREANRFAADMLVPRAEYEAFVAGEPLSNAAITAFARRVGVAPGIVVGRLQHDRHLPYTHGNQLKRHLRWVGV